MNKMEVHAPGGGGRDKQDEESLSFLREGDGIKKVSSCLSSSSSSSHPVMVLCKWFYITFLRPIWGAANGRHGKLVVGGFALMVLVLLARCSRNKQQVAAATTTILEKDHASSLTNTMEVPAPVPTDPNQVVPAPMAPLPTTPVVPAVQPTAPQPQPVVVPVPAAPVQPPVDPYVAPAVPPTDPTDPTDPHQVVPSPNDGIAQDQGGGGGQVLPAPAFAPTEVVVPAPAPTEMAGAVETRTQVLPSPTTPAATTTTTTRVFDMPPGYKRDPAYESDTYLPRARTRTLQELEQLKAAWGSWTLVDDKTRPVDIPYHAYPHRDIPRSAFPPGAWQTDAAYLEQFLQQGVDLVTRAMEAILAEYGHSAKDQPDKTEAERSKIFALTTGNIKWSGKSSGGNGGYISPEGEEQLQRSFLHAVMTEDEWNLVMGGHSSAAGHGNHVKQSFIMTIQKVMEPVLARLGVFHQAHNFGMGGLGTIQNSLGARDLYGTDIDLYFWDSSMTEGDAQSKDVFIRQGLLAGKNKVPVFWGDQGAFGYRPVVGTGVTGFWGACQAGLPNPQTLEEMKSAPFAAQFIYCNKAVGWDACNNYKYNTTCWIERDDFTPPVKQTPKVGGTAKWHPGWRYHQIQGRSLAYNLLKALRSGLETWKNTPNYELPDEAWHVTEKNEMIRKYILSKNNTPCYNFKGLSHVACEVPLHARSEFLPRKRPHDTSIRSIMKHGEDTPVPPPNCYDPPDVYQPFLDVPDSAVDYLAIVENGIPFQPNKARRAFVNGLPDTVKVSTVSNSGKDFMKPGKGWTVKQPGNADNCDGTYNSFCNRAASQTCLLSGHNDYRGYFLFDSFSGWLVLELQDVQHGLIMAEIVQGDADENKKTNGWTCENNENCGRKLREEEEEEVAETSVATLAHRRTKGKPAPPPCAEFRFEYALDGQVTSLTYQEYGARMRHLQRVVHELEILDDRNFVPVGSPPRTVELAMRITGCARQTVLKLSHVHWA